MCPNFLFHFIQIKGWNHFYDVYFNLNFYFLPVQLFFRLRWPPSRACKTCCASCCSSRTSHCLKPSSVCHRCPPLQPWPMVRVIEPGFPFLSFPLSVVILFSFHDLIFSLFVSLFFLFFYFLWFAFSPPIGLLFLPFFRFFFSFLLLFSFFFFYCNYSPPPPPPPSSIFLVRAACDVVQDPNSLSEATERLLSLNMTTSATTLLSALSHLKELLLVGYCLFRVLFWMWF